ncbi:hypothetical protein [Melittangium boletus]|uniref:Lipoprotein mlpA n=1 Tax=Melittangium boletus DSM 14713 TaxID=1294270 RepID=A0A250IJK4_9BACT|nr:hypothetical protein [Melittangium boletus]ATB31448.1 lipoprotein mlpA precursor [Melittangium boletus DSM 14713]
MKRRLIGLGMLLSACGAEQQDPQCVVARAVSDGSTGSFAVTYSLKPGQNPALACTRLKSEAVGLQKYLSQDPAAKDTVAVRSGSLGTLLRTEAARVDASVSIANAVGTLETEAPGPDNFCEVPVLSPERVVLTATPDAIAQDLTYEWSGLRIYNTPDIPGTQFIANLRYTANGCTAEFTARGIWPVVSCATSSTVRTPDESKCDPYADPPTRLRGSGINPSFPVKCDPVALICVLTGEVPSVP